MKNPEFLINGSIVVLKPIKEHENENTIAVVVGRYEKIENCIPKYLALPVILNPDEEDLLSILTRNEVMASYISFVEDDVLSIIDIVKDIDNEEWVITKTIEFLINKSIEDESEKIKIKKLENTLSDAFEEKNFSKFKWIISNIKLTDYDIKLWHDNLFNNREYYLEYFNIKDKDIDFCISKLEELLNKLQIMEEK